MSQVHKRVPISTQKRHAYNAGRFGYYQSTYPFINLRLSGSSYLGNSCSGFTVTPGTLDARGWPTALAPGNSVVFALCFSLDAVNGYFPPGNYVIKSTSSATLAIRNSDGTTSKGISAHSDGVGSATFTASAMSAGTWDQLSMYVVATNNTGAPIAITDLYVCLASEEASLLAGEIFKTDWLSLYTGARVVRFLDWLGMNAGWSDMAMAISDMHNDEGRVSYAGFADAGMPVPISICMKAAKKIGAEPHLCVPSGFGPAAFYLDVTSNKVHHCYPDLTDITQHAPLHLANGMQMMIADISGSLAGGAAAPLAGNTVYYVVNYDSVNNDYQLALTQGGAAIDFTNGGNQGPVETGNAVIAPVGGTGFDPYTNFFLPFAQACYAADPNATVHVEWTNEYWNVGPYKQSTLTLTHSSYWAVGGVANPSAGAAKPILKLWKAFKATYPANQLKLLIANQAVAPDNSWGGVWDYVDSAGDITLGQTVAQIMNANPTQYMYAFAPYGYMDYNDGFYTGTDFNSAAMQPDFVYANNGNSFASIPDSYWESASQIALAECQKATIVSVAKAKAKAPLIQCTTYEWGIAYGTTWLFNTHTGGVLVSNAYRTWVNGPKGKAMYQQMFAQTVTAHNLYCANQLLGPQGWRATEVIYDFFGITPADPANESQRNIWFKTV